MRFAGFWKWRDEQSNLVPPAVVSLRELAVDGYRNNETLARFHADCYESYFNSARGYQELAEGVDWIEQVKGISQSGGNVIN
ncbi:MAG TPA: hypothetical protein VE978_19690 [Chitinophagales bacterium]|nr:hypothetical protein [Chitinophagales bacterium]